jgi:uncharacterized protein YegP (UPF0339 family)
MIKVHQAKNGQFYLTLVARNGQVLTTSETLKTRKSVVKNIRAQLKAIGGEVVRVLWPDGNEQVLTRVPAASGRGANGFS